MFGHCILSICFFFFKVIMVWLVWVVSPSLSAMFTFTPKGVWDEARQPNFSLPFFFFFFLEMCWSVCSGSPYCGWGADAAIYKCRKREFFLWKRMTVKGSFIQCCTPGPGPRTMRPLSFILWARHTPNITALLISCSDWLWLTISIFHCASVTLSAFNSNTPEVRLSILLKRVLNIIFSSVLRCVKTLKDLKTLHNCTSFSQGTDNADVN